MAVPNAMLPNEPDLFASTPTPRYRTRRSGVNPLIVVLVAVVGLVGPVAIGWLAFREVVKREQPREEVKAEPKRMQSPGPSAHPKVHPLDWNGVLAQANQMARARIAGGKADKLAVKAELASNLAVAISRAGPIGRAQMEQAFRMLQESRNPDILPPGFLQLARLYDPIETRLIVQDFGMKTPEYARLTGSSGTPTREQTRATLEAVYANFPNDSGTQDLHADVIEKGVALALFDRAKPPAAIDYRRLQTAGLPRVAFARALESGMGNEGEFPPGWIASRVRSGGATSEQAERDLLDTAWAVAGVLPAADRAKFYHELATVLEKPAPSARQVTQAGIAAFSRLP